VNFAAYRPELPFVSVLNASNAALCTSQNDLLRYMNPAIFKSTLLFKQDGCRATVTFYNVLTRWIVQLLLTTSNRVLVEETTVRLLIKTFRAFYGTQIIITVLTRARHLSPSWIGWIHCCAFILLPFQLLSRPMLTKSWGTMSRRAFHLLLGLPSAY